MRIVAISISISIDAAFCGYQERLVLFNFFYAAFAWVRRVSLLVGWLLFGRLGGVLGACINFHLVVSCRAAHTLTHTHWRWHSHAHAHYALSTHTEAHTLTHAYTQRVSHPPPGQATGAQFSSFFFGFTFYHRLVSSASVYTQHLHTRTEQRSAAA